MGKQSKKMIILSYLCSGLNQLISDLRSYCLHAKSHLEMVGKVISKNLQPQNLPFGHLI